MDMTGQQYDRRLVMRQLEFQVKMHVLDLYLQGLSADRVAEKSGVSKGAVVTIIKDAREGKYPQLELKGRVDELHHLAEEGKPGYCPGRTGIQLSS